jgi:4-hydroxybenzoyl-CoA thioesterase
MFSNTRSVEIEFGDCDPAGIVFYPNYFRMFDASTAHLFEAALGMKKIVWLKTFDIVGIPMVDTGAKFIKPSRFGDVVNIVTTITELRRSSFVVGHQLFNDGDLAIEAHEIRVWAGADPDQPGRIKGQPLPPRVLEALSGN